MPSALAQAIQVSKQYKTRIDGTHLLCDEQVHIVAFDVLVELDALQLAALLEHLALDLNTVDIELLALVDHVHKLAGFLKLASQLSKLLDDLRITTTSLARSPDFSSPETYVRICLVGLLSCLTFERRQ